MNGPPGISARGSGDLVELRAALQHERAAARGRARSARPPACPSPGRARPGRTRSLNSCAGNVNVYACDLLYLLGPADDLEPADRLARPRAARPASSRAARRTTTRPACPRGGGSRAGARRRPRPRRAAPCERGARGRFVGRLPSAPRARPAGTARSARPPRPAARAASRAGAASRCSPRGCTRRSARAAPGRRVCIHRSKTTIDVPPSFTSAPRSKSRNASSSFSP